MITRQLCVRFMGKYQKEYEDDYEQMELVTDYIDQNEAEVYDDQAYIDRIKSGKVLHSGLY